MTSNLHLIWFEIFQRFRENAAKLVSKYFPHAAPMGRRVLVLPVLWRSCLDLCDDQIEDISLPSVAAVRRLTNGVFMDLMYYAHPPHRAEMLDSVAGEMNRLYDRLLARHPRFDGRVSIVAHSLGSVLCHDIITGWKAAVSIGDGAGEVASASLQSRLHTAVNRCVGWL